MNSTFYHASAVANLKELLPLSTLHGSGESVCYVTPVREYALFYLRDMEIDHVTCGLSPEGIAIYHEQFSDQLEKIYKNVCGYLYTCEDDRITTGHARGVWVAKEPVKVSSVTYIDNVYTHIMAAVRLGKVEIKRYDTQTAEEKEEITSSIKRLIIENRLFSNSLPKARFFKENFPKAFEAAEAEMK